MTVSNPRALLLRSTAMGVVSLEHNKKRGRFYGTIGQPSDDGWQEDLGQQGSSKGASYGSRSTRRLWRALGRLPFPEFEEHERDRLKDVLDYPPQGSSHYEPPRSAVERQRAMASPTFAVEDLVDLPSFVATLRVGSPLAEHLFSQFSAETRALFSHYEGGVDADLTEAFVRELNAVVCGPPLYEEKRFDRVDLSPATQELLKRAPEGEDLQHLNRLLLQDAYPSALSRRKVMSG